MKIRRNTKGKITISDMSPGDARYLAAAVDQMSRIHWAEARVLKEASRSAEQCERARADERLWSALYQIANRETPIEVTLSSGKTNPADLWRQVEE